MDGSTPETTASSGAWRSQATAVQHFAGLDLCVSRPITGIKIWVPMETPSTRGIQRIKL